MNRPITIAAVLLSGTALLHLVGGEGDVHAPLLASTGMGELGLYASVLWHGISVMLVLGALALWLAVRQPARHVLAVVLVSGLVIGLGLVFVGYGAARLGSIWIAPQWVLLMPVGALALWGLLPRKAV